MRNISEIIKELGPGWNLGNSLESKKNETYWGNPLTTQEMIDDIISFGFNGIRVPVRWDDNYIDKDNYIIDPNYMKRVKEVIDYIYNRKKYVIINIHHNKIQSKITTENHEKELIKKEICSVWKQISETFRDYDDHLLFDIINEPRENENWTGNINLYNVINEINEVGRSEIRKSGGNNLKRIILLPTYAASSNEDPIKFWKKNENDNQIACSIHAYIPFNFAFEGKKKIFDQNEYNELKLILNRIKSYLIDNGIYVILDEFGSSNFDNLEERYKHVIEYSKIAHSMGIPLFWWDNNSFDIGKENFGIYDRRKRKFIFPKIGEILVNEYRNINNNNINYNFNNISDNNDNNNSNNINNINEIKLNNKKKVYLFKGNAIANNWGQAISIMTLKNNGGIFDQGLIKENGVFIIEYNGNHENCAELILQSWSGGPEWVKPEKNLVEKNEKGNFVSYYSYQNCVNVFGNNFYLLDKIYVGAKGTNINVYSFIYSYN